MASLPKSDAPVYSEDHYQPAPVTTRLRRDDPPWYVACVLFIALWSPLLLLAFIARESGSEVVALVAALFGVGYIFWMRWE